MKLTMKLALLGTLAITVAGCDAATLKGLIATVREAATPGAATADPASTDPAAQATAAGGYGKASATTRPSSGPAPTYLDPNRVPNGGDPTMPQPTATPPAVKAHLVTVSDWLCTGASHFLRGDELAAAGIPRVEAVSNPFYGPAPNVTDGQLPTVFSRDAGFDSCLLGTFRGPNLPRLGSGYGAAHLHFTLARPAEQVKVEFLGGSSTLRYFLQAEGERGEPIIRSVLPGVTGGAVTLEVAGLGIRGFAVGCEANGGVLIRSIGFED